MSRKKDWTYDKQNFSRLPQIVNDLHARNMRFVPIVDPAIHTTSPYPPYDRGNKMDVFIKYKGAAIEGEVLNTQSELYILVKNTKNTGHTAWGPLDPKI